MSRATASPFSPGAKAMRYFVSRMAGTSRICVRARFFPTHVLRPVAAVVLARLSLSGVFWGLWFVHLNFDNGGNGCARKGKKDWPSPKGANAALFLIISGRLYQRSGTKELGSSKAVSTKNSRLLVSYLEHVNEFVSRYNQEGSDN